MPASPFPTNTVFLHGFLGSPEDFFPYYALTLPGHQWSPLPSGKPLLPYVIESLRAQMPKGKVILVGYSLGGRLAMHLTKAYPKMIKALILISANPGVETEQRMKQDKQWADLLLDQGIDAFVSRWYAQPLFATFKPPKNRTNHDPAALARILTELSPARLPSCWDVLPVKTLFLFGEYDIKYANIATRFKNADMIQGAGHAAFLENPNACQQKIMHFLRR